MAGVEGREPYIGKFTHKRDVVARNRGFTRNATRRAEAGERVGRAKTISHP